MTMQERKKLPTLALVLPCYNEEQVLPISLPAVSAKIAELVAAKIIGPDSFALFVDDGSRDQSWDILVAAARNSQELKGGLRRIRAISLAVNVGHQNALLAGLTHVASRCDMAISLDADLQHNIAVFEEMIAKYMNGAEIVLGIRASTEKQSWFKRQSSRLYYRLLRSIGVKIIANHADFRLMSSRALRHLRQFDESNVFLRAMPSLLHKRIAVVSYNQLARPAGRSKYNLSKMLSLAWNGITSFSIFPLRLITAIGFMIFLVSIGFSVNAAIDWFNHRTLPGWVSVTLPLYLLGGILMLSIGIVGEYLGKIFVEVKRRPRYIIDLTTEDKERDMEKDHHD
ncbi:MAG: glycosyltransferase family 2 protein [Candidatus Pacebacteria bacterium]|nr:glycosyltransferase family 2 protein [Candidatus Paceibacterota bacterium]